MLHVVLHRSGPEWDPAKPLEEQSGWDEHAAFMDRLVDDGFVVLGGPLADEHRTPSGSPSGIRQEPNPAA